jgi:hypothetical protein
MKDQTVSLSGGGSEELATGQIQGNATMACRQTPARRHRAKTLAEVRRRLESIIPVAIDVAEKAIRSGKLKLSPREREALANARDKYAPRREE